MRHLVMPLVSIMPRATTDSQAWIQCLLFVKIHMLGCVVYYDQLLGCFATMKWHAQLQKDTQACWKMYYMKTHIYTYFVSLLQTNAKRHKHSRYMQPDTHTDELICTPHTPRNSYVGSSLHLKNDYSADTPTSALCVKMELKGGRTQIREAKRQKQSRRT